MWVIIGDVHIHIHELFMKFLFIYKVIFGLCFNEDLYTEFLLDL